jgi:hypothetical protein
MFFHGPLELVEDPTSLTYLRVELLPCGRLADEQQGV